LAALRRILSIRLKEIEDGETNPTVLPLTPEAADLFEPWWKAFTDRAQALTGKLASHYGKMPGVLLRTALVLEHLWWSKVSSSASAPEAITSEAVLAAMKLVDSYLVPMGERVYGDAEIPQQARLAATFARYLVRERPPIINARDLYKSKLVQGIRDAKEAELAIEAAVDAGFLLPAPARAGPTHGRERKDYRLNPLVQEVAHG